MEGGIHKLWDEYHVVPDYDYYGTLIWCICFQDKHKSHIGAKRSGFAQRYRAVLRVLQIMSAKDD